MLRWIEDWYADRSVSEPEKVKQEMDEEKPRRGLFLITSSRCPDNMMEIVSARVLIAQEKHSPGAPLVYGAALGKDNAVRLVLKIIGEMWEASGAFALEEFLLKRNEKSETCSSEDTVRCGG